MTRPEIIAHRGASRERPENTLAAFRRAAELGADGVELDVHLTQDGVLVVHHDAIPGTAPSSALAARPIATLTLDQLQAFRVHGEAIPTLREVVAELGGQLAVYCELKGERTAAAATQLFTEAPGTFAVHAFDHRQIAEARRLAPQVPRGILEVSYHVLPLAAAESVDARDVWQQWELIDDAMVRAIHAAGKRVIAWTVNGEAEMRRLAAMGIDGLCTDDVALAKRVLLRS